MADAQNTPTAVPMGIAVWAIPASPHFESFAAQIRDLALVSDRHPYDPHVTIYSIKFPLNVIPDGMVDALTRVLTGHCAFELPVAKIGFGVRYFKRAFFRLGDPNDALSVLTELSRQAAGSSYELDPHLSLLYGDLDDDLRSHVVQRAEAHPVVSFDRLRIVLTPAGLSQQTEVVPAWHTLVEIPLQQTEAHGRK